MKGHTWKLLVACLRAFPVLMQPSMSKIKAIALQKDLDEDAKVNLWIQEVSGDDGWD